MGLTVRRFISWLSPRRGATALALCSGSNGLVIINIFNHSARVVCIVVLDSGVIAIFRSWILSVIPFGGILNISPRKVRSKGISESAEVSFINILQHKSLKWLEPLPYVTQVCRGCFVYLRFLNVKLLSKSKFARHMLWSCFGRSPGLFLLFSFIVYFILVFVRTNKMGSWTGSKMVVWSFIVIIITIYCILCFSSLNFCKGLFFPICFLVNRYKYLHLVLDRMWLMCT